jgi:hypothetical protein
MMRAFRLTFPRAVETEQVVAFVRSLSGLLRPWWQRWLTDGTTLTVFYALPRNGEMPGSCTAQEDEDRVIVRLTILVPQGVRTLMAGFKPANASVELSQPLGDRTVIDAAGNVPRPAWIGTARP